MYEEKLQNLGLTKGESKVYEALLNLGPTTVGPIVKKSKIAYSKIYDVLNRLLEKGIITYIIKEKTKYFQAEEPNRIHDYINKKQEEINKCKKILDELLPNLEKIKGNHKKEQEAEIYIGEKGLLTAYERLIKNIKKDETGYFFFVNNEEFYKKAGPFYKKSWQILKKKGNRWEGITNKKAKESKLTQSYPKFIEQRYVEFPIPGNIDIVKDKILISIWKEKPIGILINSEEAAESFINYFQAMWKISKK